MNATIICNGEEIHINITNEEFDMLKNRYIKSGYEKPNVFHHFYYINDINQICTSTSNSENSKTLYECGNYYTNSDVAVNIARANKLMRNLHRLSVESRIKSNLNWYNSIIYVIVYYDEYNELRIESYDNEYREINAIYFYDYDSAKSAINNHYDELIWYFTEYTDSVDLNVDYTGDVS